MAKGDGKSLERLYIELGLDLSQLQSDILAADKTVTENLGRLNRERNLIKLRMEADISGLDKATDAAKIFEIQEKSLNQQLTISKDRLAILEAAYKQVAANQNSTALAINKAEQAWQRERIEVGKLEQQLRELSSLKVKPLSGLLGDYQGLKGNVTSKLNELTSAFSQLKGATSSADSAITSVLGVIDAIPSPVGKAATALAGLPIIFAGIENSIVDMMKASAAAGDSVYVMSRGFQMSVKDTGKFTTMCKTAGVEVNDLASTIKRVQQQIVRGGDDSKAAEWLQKYGESAFDANGKLKDLNEMTLTLSRALKKAQAEGKGMEFILATMRNVSADSITAIEDAEGVYEQASTIVKNGLANPTLAHEVQGNLNAMGVQSGQLKASFESAFLPVANEIIPRMTERMGRLTQVIADNKDAIKSFGEGLASVVEGLETAAEKTAKVFAYVGELWRENHVVRETSTADLVKKYKDDSTIKTAEDILKREIETGGYTNEDIRKLQSRPDLYKTEIEKSQDDWSKLYEQRRKDLAEQNKTILEKYSRDDSIKSFTDFFNKLTDEEKAAIDKSKSAFETLNEKIVAMYPELESFRQATAEAAKQQLEQLQASSKVEGLRGIIKGDTSPDLSEDARKAYDEEWKQTRAFTDELYKITHNEFDNKKFDLDKWYGDLVNRAELSEKEREALDKLYAEKSAQIEQERADKLAEIRDKIAAADRTTFENRLADIEKEKDSWIQAGMDKLEADELAQKKREQLEKEVAEKVSDIRKSINAEFQTDLQNQIEKIQDEQQAWVDMGVAASEAAELAGQKMELAFEKAVDKAKSLNQSLEDKIFAQEHSQYETDIRKLQQEVAQKAQEYQKAGIFDENARALLNRYYNNALRDLNVKAGKGGDYTKTPTGAKSPIQILDYTQTQQQQNFGLFTKENAARQSVINSLTDEQRKRLEESGALDKIIAAQNSLATSTEQAADNIQDASQSIEIIHGDQVDGGGTGEVGKSFDEIIAEIIPKTELQQFGEQLNQVGQDTATSAQEVSDAQIEQTKSAQKVTEEHGKLAETAARVKDAFEAVAEIKQSGVKDTNVTKSATKSSLNGDYEQPREKVHLQTTPKDKSFLTLSDIGFDYDTAKDIFLTGAGMAAASGATGAGLALSPEILAGAVIAAIGGGVVKGTYDNRDERLNAPEKISLDDGALANIDLSEISSPLSNLDTNVQGIRDILQGKNAVADANAEATPDTSDTSTADLLSPLNNIDETAKSILSELQSRQDENELAEPINELKSELSTQLSDGASQITENISSPIQELAQQLQDRQDNNVDEKVSEISSTLTNDVAAKIQEVAQELQARNAEESTSEGNDEVTRFDDIATKVQSIFDEMQAQRTTEAETVAQTETATENADYLTPLTAIRDNVASIWSKLQEQNQTQETAQTVNLSEILSPITQNINAPLSDLRAAIDNKEFTLPEIKFPTEVIVQPLNTISQLVDQILKALSNREPPKIEISPNMDINLDGAYVFDDNLKTSLVNDITSNIVTRITEAVQSATASRSRNGSYGFGS